MRVAVTGASGFIGGPVVNRLIARRISVSALSRETGMGPSRIDLAAPEATWAEAIRGSDAVIHLAGKAHDLRRPSAAQSNAYMAVNAWGAERVAKSAAAVGARRFIHVSTVKVLGDRPANGSRFAEGDPLRPMGVYAESKAKGELLVSQALAGTRTECVIVRLPLVFGSPFKGNLATLEKGIRKGVPLPLGHSSIGRRSYVMLDELVDLLSELIDFGGELPPVLHARSADLTAAEIAWLIGEEIGHPPRIFSVPAWLVRTLAGAVRRPELASKLCDEMLVSDALTRTALGWPPA